MSEAMEEIQSLRDEVEKLKAVNADREKRFALYKEKVVEIEQQFDIAISERNRFNASVNRIAEIVGLSGKAKYELATLRERVKDLEGKRFPIQGGPSIPWSMIGPHDRQTVDNHSQTLEDLAKRGGLSPSEVLAVLDDVRWFKSKWRTTGEAECHDELERRRAEFEDETNALRDWKESQLKVEATWDPQEVARELGLKLNDDIRPNILPRIKALREERDALKKETDLGCDNHDARPHSRCSVCDGTGSVPGAFLSHVRQPCETCGGTGNELGPPFPMCSKMPECPNKDCHHYEPEDGSCGRLADTIDGLDGEDVRPECGGE